MRPGPAAPSQRGLLRERLRAHVVNLRQAEPAARSGDPVGVHDLRVALRRSRSLLTTFAALLDDRDRTDLVADLRACGLVVSPTRDHDVVRATVEELLTEEAASPDAAVVSVLLETGAPVGDVTRELLDSERYRRTADALEAEANAVPDVEPSDAWALLADDWRRLRRRVVRAGEAGEDHAEEALHRVRKAAKRTRYAAETMAPAYGEKTERLARLAEAVQDALGEHRDTVLVRDRLRALAEVQPVAALELGRLDRRAEERGERALARYRELAREVRGLKVRRS
ncbi:MAG: CHAD domain-containing protein [Nocardioidaceae bacterium]